MVKLENAEALSCMQSVYLAEENDVNEWTFPKVFIGMKKVNGFNISDDGISPRINFIDTEQVLASSKFGMGQSENKQ